MACVCLHVCMCAFVIYISVAVLLCRGLKERTLVTLVFLPSPSTPLSRESFLPRFVRISSHEVV